MELPHPVMVVFDIPPLLIGRESCLKAVPSGTGHRLLGRGQQCTEGSVLCLPGRLQVNHKAGIAQPSLWRTVHVMEHGRLTACRQQECPRLPKYLWSDGMKIPPGQVGGTWRGLSVSTYYWRNLNCYFRPSVASEMNSPPRHEHMNSLQGWELAESQLLCSNCLHPCPSPQ